MFSREAAYFNRETVSGNHNSRLIVHYEDFPLQFNSLDSINKGFYHRERSMAACESQYRFRVP